MSHIARNKDDLIFVKDIFDLLIKGNVSVGLVEEVVKNLLPKDGNGELLVGYQIYERNNHPASFSIRDNCINLSVEEMYQLINQKIDIFMKIYDGFKVDDIFKKYMLMFIIAHEIEHSYQYLMGKGIVDAPCKLVADGYNILNCFNGNENLETRKTIKNLISKYLYFKNSYRYVIERNANVEASDLLTNLSMLYGHDEMTNLFHGMLCNQLAFGYYKNSNGSFEETFSGILMLREYRSLEHNFHLSEMERVRYGLSISEETRRKSLVRK